MALAAFAPTMQPIGAKAAEVKSSTAAPASVATIYTADKLRDPFQRPSAGSGKAGSGRVFAREDFNIHNLSLHGVMKDAGTGYALFSDTVFGVSFVLRKGKLYDEKGKAVPGVTGAIDMKRKNVHLMTSDQDVQTFRLGEEGKE